MVLLVFFISNFFTTSPYAKAYAEEMPEIIVQEENQNTTSSETTSNVVQEAEETVTSEEVTDNSEQDNSTIEESTPSEDTPSQPEEQIQTTDQSEVIPKEESTPSIDQQEETVEPSPPTEDPIASEEQTSTQQTETQNIEETQEQNETPAEDTGSVTEEASEEQTQEELDFDLLPHLLITEISPNSKGTDSYEFFELYNNTNQPLKLAQYSFYYRYTDNSNEDKKMVLPDVTIAPQQSLVFWFNINSKTLTDFNTNFGTELSPEQVIEFMDDFPGFANGGNRGLVIKDNSGTEINSASYLPNETDNNGLGVQYEFPVEGIEMNKLQINANPTPGSITGEQIPTTPVQLDPIPEDTEAPQIIHEAVTNSAANTAITITAQISDNVSLPTAVLFYKSTEETDYTAIPMSANEAEFTAEIPRDKVNGNITYYMEATDGTNSTKTAEYTILVEAVEETYSELPILITEISPNTAGGGTDYYEYIELYNNSNREISTTNYSFYYRYTDNSREDILFQIPTAIIQPQETLILWYNNGNRTLEEFNTHFQTNLSSDQVVEFIDAFPGFANGGNRAFVIKDNQGKEVVSASYLGDENDNNGKVIQYIFPTSTTEMEKYKTLADPSPGSFESGQVPTNPVNLPETPTDTEAPVITHSPVKEVTVFSAITLEATVTDDIATPFVTLYYKSKEDADFIALSMNKEEIEAGKYTVTIPGSDVDSDMTYYIEATDGYNTSTTEEFTITVKQNDIDYSKIPKFLVTEIVPDSTNVGAADGYEFIEIYNNTDKDINFKDYKIQYRYGSDPATDVVWASVPDDVVIPAQGTLVFWIINSANGNQTVADFNSNYGTSLVENKDIVRIYSDGMANGSMRGLVVATNTQEEIAVSYYYDVTGVDDTVANKGILYKYPEDGSTQLVKLSGGVEDATPGSVESIQVPAEPVHIEEDAIPPTIENKTEVTEVKQTDDIVIKASAADDIGVKTVTLHYRTNSEENYKQVLLSLDADAENNYYTTIYAAELIAKESVEYYFVVSDGTNEIKTDTYTIQIHNDNNKEDLRLNVENGEILSGNALLKGTSKEEDADKVNLFIDGTEVSENGYSSLESEAYLAVEISGLNMYFKNAITMGEEIIYLMDKDNMSYWKTFTIPIDADKLAIGENEITVRAGNKASPFQLEESEENRDDYSLRNVRLILADGTEIRDPEKSNPEQVYDMGDDGTYRPFEHFHFTITDEQTKAKTYNWDTTTVADGEHIIQAKDSSKEVSSTILVDNTGPVIETNMQDKTEYKGAFTITADATDAIAGVESIQLTLDDQVITTPYETSSSQLTAGEHILKITAVDTVGNTSEETLTFSVQNENPEKAELVSPADYLSTPVDGDPTLQVRVMDPTNDAVDVTFYQGFQYTTGMDSVKAYKNATDTEPPQEMTPEGEEAFSVENNSLTSKLDGNYLTTDSDTQFPYHRFDVTLDSSVTAEDTVELVWNGNSLEGRKVSMYAWSYIENNWKLLTYKIAGTEDFELKADADVSEFAKDSKIQVLVQDEIPRSPDEYDYTFVWMSDTQYYSESYPYIYQRQTEWIAEKQEELKIEYVFHTGDVVDEFDQEQQWIYADEYMRTLEENNIPYGVLAGNHDVDQLSNDYTEFSKWFGADRFEDSSVYGESYKNNRGHYDLVSANGNDFIMVYMGWGVEAEDLEWMNDVLAQYPDRKAILSFHEYLLVSGNRSPIGDHIYTEVVEKNPNVLAVLSGHYHDSETLVSEIDDDGDGVTDRQVYQMLGDYQGGPEGGQGYVKLLHFDQDNNRIFVNTYSPYLDDYNFYDPTEYPGKDELIMDMDLQVEEKRVATDYFAVNVYTKKEIGKAENVASGEIAEVVWEGLETGQQYYWYAVIEDDFTGKSTSDIWSFTKGKVEENEPETPTDDNEDPDNNNGEDPGSNDGDNDQGNEEDPGSNDGDNDQGNEENPGSNDGEHGQDKDEESYNNQEENQDPSEENSEQGSNENVLEENNKQDTNETTTPENQKGESALPDTATNYYNNILIGLAMLIAGVAFYLYYRRKVIL